MTYDALNRILTKSYTGGSPTASLSYTYDISSVDGHSGLTNPIGRLVKDSAVTSAGAANFYYDYDTMGRKADLWECLFGCGPGAWHTFYKYDLAGNLTNYSDSSFATYAQTFDGASRLTEVTSTYPSGSPASLINVNTYFPSGQIGNMTYGNGLTATNVYNNRLQPCRMNLNSAGVTLLTCTDAVPGGNVLDFTYSYGTAARNNGNVMFWSATGRQTFSHTYAYDFLNRLTSMAGSGGLCTALNWTYDTWGNRLTQTAPAGGGTCFQPQFTYLASNRISGYGYDAAGNLTSQTGATYTYDNENRLVATTGTGGNATYTYDADGRRVQKLVGTTINWSYSLDKDGNITAWLAPGGRGLGYVYMNGQILAQYENGTIYYHHHDHLGSTRLLTELNQGIQQCLGYYPFGEFDVNQCAPTVFNYFTTTQFTGKERDTETGNDYFGARYDASSMGRWMSPDPSSLGVDIYLPQTWNRYNYALNNPLGIADRNGMWPFYIHFAIAHEAFPGMSSKDLRAIYSANWHMDFDSGQQEPNLAFEHGERDGSGNWGANPVTEQQESRDDADKFISDQVAAAQKAQADWEAQGHSGIAPAALTAFGNALHTVTDRTSPMHQGEQPWANEPWYHKEMWVHFWGEKTINSTQMAAAKSAAQALFTRTFGHEFDYVFGDCARTGTQDDQGHWISVSDCQ
jgi:RHS repeat-associated protein